MTRIPRLTRPISLENLVKLTIKKGNDLKTLSVAATQYAPEGTGHWYHQETINNYLDWYNVTMKHRSFSTTKKVDGEWYMVPDETACRQYSLFQTYRQIAKDNGINTSDWYFHPHQTYLEE